MEFDFKNYQVVPLSMLVIAEWNYKQEDDENKISKLKANFKRNGQVENILVREVKGGKLEVVNGNHRLIVMQELNFEKAIVYNFGKISDAQAKRIAIETNETKFPADHVKLAEIFKELGDTFDVDDLIETMPYSKDDLEGMSKLLDFDFDAYNDDDYEKEEGDSKITDEKEVECPECGHWFVPTKEKE